jgi:hypothetical protein
MDQMHLFLQWLLGQSLEIPAFILHCAEGRYFAFAKNMFKLVKLVSTQYNVKFDCVVDWCTMSPASHLY